MDEDLAHSLLQQILDSGDNARVAIDTETNEKDIRDGRGYAYGVSICGRVGDGLISFYMPFRHTNKGSVGNYDLQRFLPVLQQIIRQKTGVYHNAKFDLVSLRTLGLDVAGSRFFDTLDLCHKLDENHKFEGFSGDPYSLDVCCQKYLGRSGKKKSEIFKKALATLGWAELPPEAHGEYAAYDSFSTYELFEALIPYLQAEDLYPIWLHRQKFIELIIEMESNGVRIDVDLCDAMAEEGEIRMGEIQQELGKHPKTGKLLNPASPLDLAYLLIDTLRLPEIKKTRKRKDGSVEVTRTFDKDAMEQYDQLLERINNPLAKLVLEYRGWQKTVSSNYLPYLHLLSPDGRLRPNYKLHGTVTGRMSCEKPNLQQIPRAGAKPWNGNLKQAFIPEDGYVLIECDYSQLEFRLNAGYGEEAALLEIFADPTRDVFQEMADLLGWKRQDVKTFVYSIAYGAGAQRISFVFGVSIARAKELIAYFYNLYPGLKKASDIARGIALRKGKVPVWSGRYRHFLNPQRDARKALNSMIQGGAADVVERTMLRLAEAGFNDGIRSRMLLQVHDSVVFEILRDDADAAKHEISKIMSDVPYDFGVVFRADAKEWGK